MECIVQGKTRSELIPMEDTIAILELLEDCKKSGKNKNNPLKICRNYSSNAIGTAFFRLLKEIV